MFAARYDVQKTETLQNFAVDSFLLSFLFQFSVSLCTLSRFKFLNKQTSASSSSPGREEIHSMQLKSFHCLDTVPKRMTGRNTFFLKLSLSFGLNGPCGSFGLFPHGKSRNSFSFSFFPFLSNSEHKFSVLHFQDFERLLKAIWWYLFNYLILIALVSHTLLLILSEASAPNKHSHTNSRRAFRKLSQVSEKQIACRKSFQINVCLTRDEEERSKLMRFFFSTRTFQVAEDQA